MKKGLPLMGYHRFLVPLSQRRAAGQAPQNHFTFYATQPQQYGGQYNPHYAPPQRRQDGTYPDAPPMYSNEAPPGYVPPPGATKTNWNQGPAQQQQMEMPVYPGNQGGQQSGVVGRDEEQGFAQQQNGGSNQNGNGNAELPDRPQQAKLALGKLMGRFRR